jgi:hypothetical protein
MAFLDDRLAAIEAQIIAFEGAMLALGNDNIQAYTLDTGQTVQKVTRLDLEWMTGALDGLLNQHTVLQARLKRNGTTIGSTSW